MLTSLYASRLGLLAARIFSPGYYSTPIFFTNRKMLDVFGVLLAMFLKICAEIFMILEPNWSDAETGSGEILRRPFFALILKHSEKMAFEQKFAKGV